MEDKPKDDKWISVMRAIDKGEEYTIAIPYDKFRNSTEQQYLGKLMEECLDINGASSLIIALENYLQK